MTTFRKSRSLRLLVAVAVAVAASAATGGRPASADPEEPAVRTCETDGTVVPALVLAAEIEFADAVEDWCNLKPEGRDLCVDNFLACFFVNTAKQFALDQQYSIIQDAAGVLNGRMDAARHCLLAADLTVHVGWAGASPWLFYHEWENVGQRHTVPEQHAMDFHNNDVAVAKGLELVRDGMATEEDVVQLCRDLVTRNVHVAAHDSGDRREDPLVAPGDYVSVARLTADDGYQPSPIDDQLVYFGAYDTRQPWTRAWPHPVFDVSYGGSFRQVWDDLGGPQGPLGLATQDYALVGNTGQQQAFAGGTLFWSESTGTQGVQGLLLSKYQSLGGPGGQLGFPTSFEDDVPGGKVSYFAGTDCYADHGAGIYFSQATGAHLIKGCIFHDYLTKTDFGGPGGQFGLPTTDEQATNGGYVNYMSGSPCSSGQGLPHSALYHKGDTWGVKGCIFLKYRQMGETTSALGWPRSLEYSTAAGIRQDFSNGYMMWADGVATPYYTGPSLVIRSAVSPFEFVSNETDFTGINDNLLRARNSYLGSKEAWTQMPLGGGEVALRSNANGLYVSTEIDYTGGDYAKLRARSTTVGMWERYKIVNNTDGTYSLQSLANGLYVNADLAATGNAHGQLRAIASSIGPQEKFTTFSGDMATCVDYGVRMNGPGSCHGFTKTGAWNPGGGVGLHGQEIWTYAHGTTSTAIATYALSGLTGTKAWLIEAYIPNNYSNATHAHYRANSLSGGTVDGYVNQSAKTNEWASTGMLVCSTDGTATVWLYNDGGDQSPIVVGADAIRATATTQSCAAP